MNQERNASWSDGAARKIMWSGAAVLLALPVLAMRFTNEVNWTAADFVSAALLLFGSAGLIDIVMRASSSPAYRAGAAVAIAAGFLTLWVNGAVGMIGSEGNGYNLLFIGVVALALGGGLVTGFRARGMAGAMMLAGLAQAVVSLGGIAADPRGAVFSGLFAGLWLLAAALFRKAAGKAQSA